MYCSLVYSIVIYFNQVCHFSGSFNDDIIGPGEESTTWKVKFPLSSFDSKSNYHFVRARHPQGITPLGVLILVRFFEKVPISLRDCCKSFRFVVSNQNFSINTLYCRNGPLTFFTIC